MRVVLDTAAHASGVPLHANRTGQVGQILKLDALQKRTRATVMYSRGVDYVGPAVKRVSYGGFARFQ